MKIAIIGAGLSGLSTAISLRKYCKDSHLDITIYERPSRHFDKDETGTRKRQSELGAGISLQSNGLRALENLEPRLRDKVYASGFPCDHFKWKTAGGLLLGKEPVNALPISRPILIDCLMGFVPDSLFVYKTIDHVVAEGPRPVLVFADDSPDVTVDLVIGADGVGSIVRKAIFPVSEQYKPQYLGHCAVGGVLQTPIPEGLLEEPCIKFFLGSTGAFGYTGLSQSDHDKLLYFSIFDTDLPLRGEKPNPNVLLKELRERHGDWSDPMIARCLSQAEVDNVYPIFAMPELPYWGRHGCVLIGDAAHSLPSSSGQGSSQAFEDGEIFGLLLAGYLKKFDVANAVTSTIDALYAVRHRRVYKIRSMAMAWKDPERPMSLLKTLGMYCFLFIFIRVRYLMTFWESVDDWNASSEVRKYFDSQDSEDIESHSKKR